MDIDYNSPSSIKSILEFNNFSAQKKFGQNFLINENARNKIIDSLDIQKDMSVWEIGPGLGAMTKLLLEKGAIVRAFEIDHGFIKLLENIFREYIQAKKLKIIAGDVLKTWISECNANGIPDRFFGNLPYNVASAIIANTIENNVRFEKAVVTVQKEVAERMVSKEGSKNWSSFSVLCNWAYNMKHIIDLSGSNFWPKPHVASSVIVLTKKDDFPMCKNSSLFMKMQRALFSSRRKNIKNNLLAFVNKNELAIKVLEKANIPLDARAEALSLKTLLNLSDVINADILNV